MWLWAIFFGMAKYIRLFISTSNRLYKFITKYCWREKFEMDLNIIKLILVNESECESYLKPIQDKNCDNTHYLLKNECNMCAHTLITNCSYLLVLILTLSLHSILFLIIQFSLVTWTIVFFLEWNRKKYG